MRIPVRELNLEATLESGQVFGFDRKGEGLYEGPIGAWRVELARRPARVEVRTLAGPSPVPAPVVRAYFDLERDLGPVYRILGADPRLEAAAARFRGLRVVRQDPWEALAAFILSANNHIKRIRRIWRNLLGRFADDGLFPRFASVARSGESELRALGLGYRAPYLLGASRRIEENPQRFYGIRSLDYAEAKLRILEYPGVGDKVGDCVLLFGFQKGEAFPVDTWILRAMRRLYFAGRRVPERRVSAYARRKWKAFAGYVQQYMFHGARTGILALALLVAAGWAGNAAAEAPDGTTNVYYDNGRIRSQTTYRGGVPEGPYRLYYEDGVLAEEGNYLADQPDGTVRKFAPEGFMTLEGEYRAGALHGMARKFYPDGGVDKEWSYEEGRRSGPARTYYPDGKLQEEAFYRDDRLDGTLKRYFENGAVQEEIIFVNGSAEGPIKMKVRAFA